MSTSGIEYFTNKCELIKTRVVGFQYTESDLTEFDRRAAIPYRSLKRNDCAQEALQKLQKVISRDYEKLRLQVTAIRHQERNTRASDPTNSEVQENNSNGNRTPADKLCPPAKKTIRIVISKKEGIVKFLCRRLDNFSRRYNGPDGNMTAPKECMDYKEKENKLKTIAKLNTSNQNRRLPLEDLRDQYYNKIDTKISDKIRSWTIPTAKRLLLRPQHPVTTSFNANYQSCPRDFILGTFSSRLRSIEGPFLASILQDADEQDVLALASSVTSYIESIIREGREYYESRKYTQEELVAFRPEILNRCNNTNYSERTAEHHRWKDWKAAKRASISAQQVVLKRRLIAETVRGIEKDLAQGRPWPNIVKPLTALPLQMRLNSNDKVKAGWRGHPIPSTKSSLSIHAATVGRSKLSEVISSKNDS